VCRLQERRSGAPLTRARRRRLALAAVVAAAVVALDQLTTSLAEDRVRRPEHLFGPLGLAVTYNSGSAFSLFTGAVPLLVVVVVVLVGVLSIAVWRARSTGMASALGMVLGGALGNLYDRLLRGHHGDVVDFVTLSHWPTFNPADASITIGIVVVIALYWRREPA